MKVMLDTNILISAFVFKSKVINELIYKLSNPFRLVYSPMVIEEKLFEIRDECDYMVLYTAILENVDVLITGDKDFKEVDVKSLQILTPREFLDKY